MPARGRGLSLAHPGRRLGSSPRRVRSEQLGRPGPRGPASPWGAALDAAAGMVMSQPTSMWSGLVKCLPPGSALPLFASQTVCQSRTPCSAAISERVSPSSTVTWAAAAGVRQVRRMQLWRSRSVAAWGCWFGGRVAVLGKGEDVAGVNGGVPFQVRVQGDDLAVAGGIAQLVLRDRPQGVVAAHRVRRGGRGAFGALGAIRGARRCWRSTAGRAGRMCAGRAARRVARAAAWRGVGGVVCGGGDGAGPAGVDAGVAGGRGWWSTRGQQGCGDEHGDDGGDQHGGGLNAPGRSARRLSRGPGDGRLPTAGGDGCGGLLEDREGEPGPAEPDQGSQDREHRPT